jgi:hypothetical protein
MNPRAVMRGTGMSLIFSIGASDRCVADTVRAVLRIDPEAQYVRWIDLRHLLSRRWPCPRA